MTNTEISIQQDVREAYAYFFSRVRMRSSDCMNKKKSCSVHMTVFEIVVHRNVDNWIQLLT